MDLDNSYFVGHGCLAIRYGINGLGSVLREKGGTETRYLLRDANGYYYLTDLEDPMFILRAFET